MLLDYVCQVDKPITMWPTFIQSHEWKPSIMLVEADKVGLYIQEEKLQLYNQ